MNVKYFRTFIFLAAMSAFGVCLHAQTWQEYFDSGSIFYSEGDFAQAVKDYGTALSLGPVLPQMEITHNNRGLAYVGLKQYQSAIDDYNAAININPKNAEVYFNRGNAYFRMGKLKEAIADYDAAIGLYPKFAWAYSNRGLAYFDLGQLTQAIKDYDAAINYNYNLAKAYLNRGAAYEKLGQVQRARADYRNGVGYNSKLAEGSRYLCEASGVTHPIPAGAYPSVIKLKNGIIVKGNINAQSGRTDKYVRISVGGRLINYKNEQCNIGGTLVTYNMEEIDKINDEPVFSNNPLPEMTKPAPEVIASPVSAAESASLSMEPYSLIKIALNGSDKMKRIAAIRELGRVKEQTAFDPLLGMLSEPDLEIRLEVMRGLAALGDPAIFQPFKDILESQVSSLSEKGAAIGGISWLKSVPQAGQVLADFLVKNADVNDQNYFYLNYAAAGGLFNLQAQDQLDRLAKHPDEKVRSYITLVKAGIDKQKIAARENEIRTEQAKANEPTARNNMKTIYDACQKYYKAFGKYPQYLRELQDASPPLIPRNGFNTEGWFINYRFTVSEKFLISAVSLSANKNLSMDETGEITVK